MSKRGKGVAPRSNLVTPKHSKACQVANSGYNAIDTPEMLCMLIAKVQGGLMKQKRSGNQKKTLV